LAVSRAVPAHKGEDHEGEKDIEDGGEEKRDENGLV
jgi:hypothetical protein